MSSNPLAPKRLSVPADANELQPGVWPNGAARDAAGMLRLAGVGAETITQQFGTPVYVVDESDLRTRAKRMLAAFTDALATCGAAVNVYYAGKAFLCTEVARWVREEGLGVDVASGGELAVALAAGVPPERIGLHGNNKSLNEIDTAVAAGVGSIIIDSLIEIERVASAALRNERTQPVRLRINSGVHASTHEYLATAHEDQKFGVPLSQAPDAVAAIRSHPQLSFLGLHSHIGSQIFDGSGFAEAAARLMELHARLLADGPVPQLNLGGGFGIAYTATDTPAAIEEIAQKIAAALREAAAVHGIPVPDIAIEPGRSIVGPSTVTIYEVGTVKPLVIDSPSGTAVRTYVSVDGGMSDNIRPALYRAEYSARIASRVSQVPAILTRVVGKHCEGGDIVVHDEYLPGDIEPGDLLAVPATGAYGWAMASNYNWIPRPPVVAVLDGNARLIVRGETVDDLLQRDVGFVGTPRGSEGRAAS